MNLYKKIISALVLIAFALSATAVPAYAVNANANAKATAKAETKTNKGKGSVSLQLNENLKVGSKGDAVKLLQTLLASDQDLSQTDITGYFGPKTFSALKKFQKKNGLPSVGLAGPMTRAKLNAKLSTIELEEDTTSTGQSCVKIPPGHLIAPGWLRKQTASSAEVQVPICQILPPGILKKLNGGWSGGGGSGGSSDTTAPKVSNIVVSPVSTTSATLKFTTNENAVYEVMVGTTASYGTTSIKTTTFAKSHTYVFSGLTADTTYHYQIKVYDMAGNSGVSADKTFITVETDEIDPVITAIAVSAITHNSATIYWTTSEGSTTEVSYGTTNAYGSTSNDLTLVTVHTRTLTGLSSGQQYHYQVKSTDGAANSSTSGDLTFTTTAAPDTTAPVIGSIASSSVTNSSASVSWTTNENATGKIYWSTTNPVNTVSSPSVTTALSTNHTAPIAGLTANTTYYYLIEAKDASMNTSTSTGSFVTNP